MMSVTQLVEKVENNVIYPDSDGESIVANTKQFDWISNIFHHLRPQFDYDPNVFIARDFIWYPVENNYKIHSIPDAISLTLNG